LLADACESGDPLGFNNETQLPNVQQFCSYHQCAYGPNLPNKTEDYYACQCRSPIANKNGVIAECCDSISENEESDLSASCACAITNLCEQGQVEMCLAASYYCCTDEDCRQSYEKTACNEITYLCNLYGDLDYCTLAADNCCLEGDEIAQDECKRDYLKVGCDGMLQKNSTVILTASDCCLDGDVICEQYYLDVACDQNLKNNAFTVSDSCYQAVNVFFASKELQWTWFECNCNFWGSKCETYPGVACDYMVTSCCAISSCYEDDVGYVTDYGCYMDDVGYVTDYGCACDVYTFAASLGYERPLKGEYCTLTASISSNTHDMEISYLREFYNKTGGDDWLNNTGWPDDQIPHCEWYGVRCNEDGQVSALLLKNNNLVGSLDTFHNLSFPDLEELDLAENQLYGGIPYLYYHRKLSHVDLSWNKLTGRIDALLSPSLEYVNISHNNLEQVYTFKKFKGSHEKLRTLDLSHNSINQNASEIFVNVPTNLRELILSDNLIQGTFPSRFEVLPELEVFRVDNNMLSGSIPDVVGAFPLLGVLDLSNQGQSEHGLSGPIPKSISNLVSLSVLDLSCNRLV
jgi:hypothetical protein